MLYGGVTTAFLEGSFAPSDISKRVCKGAPADLEFQKHLMRSLTKRHL